MIHLWRGFHHRDLMNVLTTAWDKNELVILVPSHLKDFSFLKKIEGSRISFCGEWSDHLKNQALEAAGTQTDANLNEVALGVFTSGTSTGQSRLVYYSKKNITSSLSAIRQLFEIKRIKKIFCYPQPTHTFGLLLGYMQAALHKVELVFSPGAYSHLAHVEWLKTVDEGTLTLGAPTHFLDLMKFVKTNNLKVPSSYSAIVGGARVTGELWENLRTVLHVEAPSVGYGATEAAPGVTHLPPGVKPAEDGDIGYALQNVEIEVSAEGLEFKGPNLCHLVFENQQFKRFDKIILKDAVVKVPTHHGSRYTFLGRVDSIINRGGIKISLEDAESAIANRFGCKCAAVSLYDARLGDDLGLIIQSENTLSKKQIQQFVHEQWGIKLGDDPILFASVPLNPNGKVDRTEATKLILKSWKWEFPVGVEHLRSLLPHKGPAIWVDKIKKLELRQGVVQVNLESSKNYFSPRGDRYEIRETACIEWIAQAYGYITALNDVLDLQKADAATRTFIAEVKSAEFNFHKYEITDQEVLIKVNCTHDFGTLKVIEGQVTQNENLLSKVNVKVYCGS